MWPKLVRLLAGHCRGRTHRPPPAALSTSSAGARLVERQRARGHSRVFNPVVLAACEGARTATRRLAAHLQAGSNEGCTGAGRAFARAGRDGRLGWRKRAWCGGAAPTGGARPRLFAGQSAARGSRTQTSCDEALDTRTDFTHFERRHACSCAPRWHHTPRGDILHETVWRVAGGSLAGCGASGPELTVGDQTAS